MEAELHKYSNRDLKDAQSLLSELQEEVFSEESTLSGGVNLVVGSGAVEALRRTNVSFGNPRNDLIRLTEKLFDDVRVPLNDICKRQMKEQFDFYYLTLALSIQSGRGIDFSRVECLLSLGPKGDEEPIIHAIFPKAEWRDLLQLGGSVNLALRGNLDWGLGVDPVVLNGLSHLPGNLKASVGSSNSLNAYVTVPNYTFKLGSTKIAATGEGHSDCFWRIEKPILEGNQTVQFGIVFKVPKGQTSIDLTGTAIVEPDISWLLKKLSNVFEYLSDKFKQLFLMPESNRKGKDRLPLGDSETWHLVLPK